METVRRVKCNAKLKTIGVGFASYAADNNGVIPCVVVESNGGTNPSRGNWLMELSAYLNKKGAVTSNNDIHDYSVCPTYEAKYSKDPAWTDWKGGYGMNYNLFRPAGDNNERSKKERLPLAVIPSPSKNILIADCGPSVGLISNADGSFPENASNWSKHNGADPERHAGRANYLFVDGHASTLSEAEAVEFLKTRDQ